jgi:DNA modification methylase
MGTMKSDVVITGKNQTYQLGSYDWHLPIENVQTWIVDPPYNIGYNYKSDFADKMTPQEYSNLHYDFLELAFDSTNDGGSFFLINYPEIIAEYYHSIMESRWSFHQWMTWVYPSNIGMSKSKFTRASRTILWLTKGKPLVKIDAVTQPYKNPTDKRVQKLIGGGELELISTIGKKSIFAKMSAKTRKTMSTRFLKNF